VNDAVPQPARGLLFQDFGVGVHHPVDGTVSDGARADVGTGLMEQTDLLTIDFGIGGRVDHVPRVCFREVLIPGLMHPGGARAAGKQQTISQRRSMFGQRGDLRRGRFS